MRNDLAAEQLRDIVIETFAAMSPHATPWLPREAIERDARQDPVFGAMLRYIDELDDDNEVPLYNAVVGLIEEDARLMAYAAFKMRDAAARRDFAAVS